MRYFRKKRFSFFKYLTFVFQHWINFYYSPLGNQQYTLTPFTLSKKSYCDYINGDFRKLLMESAKPPATNFPYSEDPNVDLCDKIRTDHDVS